MARCAIFVSYMATHLQLPVLISRLLNGTFKITLQHVMINGVAAMVLGSHEGFSYFPESLTLHNCSEHCHTCLVLLPLITAVPCVLCHSSCVRLVLRQPQDAQGVAMCQPRCGGLEMANGQLWGGNHSAGASRVPHLCSAKNWKGLEQLPPALVRTLVQTEA